MTLMKGRREATPEEQMQSMLRADRVERVAALRRVPGSWNHKAQAELAASWGITRKAMETIAAEAGRVVAREVADPAGVTIDVGTALRQIVMSPASDNRDRIRAGEVLSKIAGLMVDRHEVTQVEPVAATEEWAELRQVLLDALKPYPEAHAAVVSALLAYRESRGTDAMQ